MRILRFEGKGLYGYLDLSPSFNLDLTFLVGINGSGKTSVIRAISALLTPSFLTLARWDYSSILVEVEHVGVRHTIESSRTKEHFTLSINSIDEPLCVSIAPEELFEYKQPDSEITAHRLL